MSHLRTALSIGTSAALLASLLTTAFAGTAAAAAAAITGAASSTAASTTAIPTTNVATALSTAPVLTGTVATDAAASGNLVLTLTNAAFSFDCTAAPTLTLANATLASPVTCAAATLTSAFSATVAGSMSVTWNGVKVKTTTAAASSTIVATATGGATMVPASVTVANVTSAAPGGRDADRGMGHGARKVGFFDNPAYSCPTGATPAAGAGTFGFAILNTTGKKVLNINVVLKGALPNATYDVWVNQDPGACPLAAPTKAGAVHTNGLGNGTGHLRISVVSGAQHFWVSAVSGASVLRTRAATLTIKGK